MIPYQAVTTIQCHRALVLAPHPDDEVFGCGGAILRHVEAGVPVRVIIVTDGGGGVESSERAGYVRRRQEESLEAGKILGYGSPAFWGFPDRGVSPDEALIRKFVHAIESCLADLVYAPSLHEVHPDHWAVGMAAVEAVRRCGHGVKLAMYEVGVPLRPNVLLDIGDVLERKLAAMACFKSQLAQQPYDRQILALNRFRTYTLRDVEAAEAFYVADQGALEGVFTRERALYEEVRRLAQALEACRRKGRRWRFWRGK